MTRDELSVMSGSKCILQLRGVRPFLSDKYDLTKHPNYRYTADADPKNVFSVEKFLDHRAKLRPDDVFDVVKAEEMPEDVTDDAEDALEGNMDMIISLRLMISRRTAD